jgi:hypothetical protein
LKMAPEPVRDMVSEPEANALDEIVVGVAVKLAKVPPTAPTAITQTAARLRRSFDNGRDLNMRVHFLSWVTRSPSNAPEWRRVVIRNEFRMT